MRVRGMRDTITGIAREFIKEKVQDLLQGNSDRNDDVLALLGKLLCYLVTKASCAFHSQS